MVASSVISMSIRQIRHLSEKPTDFFRLPVFIIVSTFFLMPIRLIGFFRMAHASGWGTRAGAYAGGPAEISSDEEIAAYAHPAERPAGRRARGAAARRRRRSRLARRRPCADRDADVATRAGGRAAKAATHAHDEPAAAPAQPAAPPSRT